MITPGGITGTTKPILCDETYEEIGPVSGYAWGALILGIPVSLGGPNLAMRNALKKSGGDAVMSATVDLLQIMLGPVTIFKTTVKGTAIRIKKK